MYHKILFFSILLEKIFENIAKKLIYNLYINIKITKCNKLCLQKITFCSKMFQT